MATKKRFLDSTAGKYIYDVKITKYVKKLHKIILTQRKRIKKLKLKIKKMKYLSKLDHVKIPEEENEEVDSDIEAPKEQEEKEESVQDFLNDIKSAASQFVLEQNFIYEPTSGLYYDPRTGYYYNAEYGLYYDGNTGCYYKYNEDTGQYEFHSQVKTENNAETNKEEIDEDEAIRKILEDGRKPLKSQESNGKKEELRRDRRASYSSESDSDADKYYTKRCHSRSRSRGRYRSRSRSRSKSRGRDRRRSKSHEKRYRSKSRGKEDGELDTSDSNNGYVELESQQPNFQKRKRKKKRKDDYEEIAKKYPPSMRIIVLETNLDKIDVGKLFLVTYKGGTLGREGDHNVLIPDINVSKLHLKFKYNHKKSSYQIVDLSKNGTILNEIQISNPTRDESQFHDLVHGSVLQLNQTKLLCHIHDGITTCDDCEPYNYIKAKTEPKSVDVPNLSHKEQLKLLQKRYGLETEKYNEKQGGQVSKTYVDRAEKRRVKIGSLHDGEKTVQASLDTSIATSNKGFKMLSKMGWKGESLGKDNSGIKEPVPLVQNTGTSGLGFETVGPSTSYVSTDKKKSEILYKTQQRYNTINSNNESEDY